MKVAVIVLTNNSKDYLAGCLKSIGQLILGDTQLEIVVVDNASDDGTVNLVQSQFPKVTILANDRNLGFADGNNIGIRYALAQNSDFIWIISPDTVVDKNALSELMFAANRYPGAGMFGPKIYYVSGHEPADRQYEKENRGRVIWYAGGQVDWDKTENLHRGINEADTGQFDHDVEIDFITRNCMFIRRRLFDSVGLFDPQYYLSYEEDDLCQRAMQSGWKLMFVAKSLAWYANKPDADINPDLHEYYTTRNRLLFGLHYGGPFTKLMLLKDSVILYFNGRPWQRRAVADYFHKNLGPGSFQP